MFICGFVVAARNNSRFRFATAWAGNIAIGWHIHANAERRLLVADERPRADSAGDSPTFAGGRGGVRRIFENDDADVPVRETDFVDDSAGPDNAAAEGFKATSFFDATIPRFVER